ncbi:MAG: chromate efflux transporter [Dehalococcoidia bacterium]|nr:chromate efflux transporter [Dehalococcoidia bacterium]
MGRPEEPGAEQGLLKVQRGPVGEVALLFLKLGFTAFGGPPAAIALMRDEAVRRRRWLNDQQFLDLVGAANLIPGPSATELAIFLGYARAGWRGLVLAGSLFILPATLIAMALAWAYVQYGATPGATWLLYGVKPVIIAIILHAVWGLGRTAVKNVLLGTVGVLVLTMYLLGFNIIALLFGGGLVVMAVRNFSRLRPAAAAALAVPGFGVAHLTLQSAAGTVPFSLATLFLTFLKIGAVLYGSGYVLLAFLRADFGEQLGWLTDRQLIDAVAVGQFTPGPVFSTATFIGYLVGGLPGGVLATLGIFLPSFVFVAVVFPLVPRLRRSPWTSAFLDGINVSAIGLMAAVTWQLGQAGIVDLLTGILAVVAAVLLVRFKINSVWLIIGGGAIGLAYQLLLV